MLVNIGFDNISNHVIPMDQFYLKWRFTERKYKLLPYTHLNQLKPLDKSASAFLWGYISLTDVHANVPFKRNLYKEVNQILRTSRNEREIKKWLFNCGFSFSKEVYLSWNPESAMIVPWKLLIKYFDDFAYLGSDDLTVIDASLNWALLFFHEGMIYFGANVDKLAMLTEQDEKGTSS